MRNATVTPDVNPEDKQTRRLRQTLTFLVYLLVFEGLARKLEPGIVGILIFLFKDVVVLFMGWQLATQHKIPPAIHFLFIGYVAAIILFVPCIFSTATHDPLLAVFGAKQYLLYPIVGIATFVAFQNATVTDVIAFCRRVALLMIPTGLVAVLQTQLSPDNWLNLSVDGASLADFSSAGHLRVSSTFSFVSQFCGFLNMEMFMLFLALHGWKTLEKKWLYVLPVVLLVVCSYLTGSRGAVVGNTMVIVIAVALCVLRFEVGKIANLLWIGGFLFVVVVSFQYLFPSLMATYSVREGGQVVGVSPEVRERVYGAFFGWMAHAHSVPFFGNGLGIMSNGSDSLSAYSRSFRSTQWTETDLATTYFEGGTYLMFVWYGFRYYIIYQTTRRILFGVSRALLLPAAFCQAFVILSGLTGTLGMQPPAAIWWWLGVGLSTTLWWKSVRPVDEPPAPPPPERVIAPRGIRGRSAYAEQLHGQP
jgi:hypothetical protein